MVFGEDVEMRDSSARPEQSRETDGQTLTVDGDESVKPALTTESGQEGMSSGSAALRDGSKHEKLNNPTRPMAGGAVTREFRRRQRKKSSLRRARVDTDDEVSASVDMLIESFWLYA